MPNTIEGNIHYSFKVLDIFNDAMTVCVLYTRWDHKSQSHCELNNGTSKKCIVVHTCVENTWKMKQINVDGFPVRDSNWRHLESDSEFKTLPIHPQINKNTAYSVLATLSSGSRRLMYFHP